MGKLCLICDLRQISSGQTTSVRGCVCIYIHAHLQCLAATLSTGGSQHIFHIPMGKVNNDTQRSIIREIHTGINYTGVCLLVLIPFVVLFQPAWNKFKVSKFTSAGAPLRSPAAAPAGAERREAMVTQQTCCLTPRYIHESVKFPPPQPKSHGFFFLIERNN